MILALATSPAHTCMTLSALTLFKYSLFAGGASANAFISCKWARHILHQQQNYNKSSFALFRNSSSSIYRCILPCCCRCWNSTSTIDSFARPITAPCLFFIPSIAFVLILAAGLCCYHMHKSSSLNLRQVAHRTLYRRSLHKSLVRGRHRVHKPACTVHNTRRPTRQALSNSPPARRTCC